MKQVEHCNHGMFNLKSPLVAVALAASLSCMAGNPVFTVDAGHPTGKVSPTLYGLMTEEINHSYDGGLYAELIQNRAFLNNAEKPAHWSAVNDDGSTATISLDSSNSFNDKLVTSLRLMVTKSDRKHPAGVANDGYWGIPVQPKTTYHARILAKSVSDVNGPVTVAIVSDEGSRVYASGKFSGLTTEWKEFEVTLKTGRVAPTTKAHFILTIDEPATVWLGMVSLFPPTWDNQPNGFRKDLMQMLVDLNPKFLRLPGGNYVEGDTVENRFDWKRTIGPIGERAGHPSPWGYRSTDGLGLLEYLQWCEDMRAEPVLAVYAGYSLKGSHVNPGPDLEPFVEEALDEIEYVAGGTNTTWGAQRAKDGHPAPFRLNYVEIGNEDWFDRSKSYDARYTQFYDAIKAKYPRLKLISTIGDDQPETSRVKSRKPDVMDGHYYRSADTFLRTSPEYATKYDRNSPEIFIGEWASYETSFPPWDKRSQKEPPTPDLKAALGDAAFMAAMERNSDLIKMQCYAPLLVNVNPGGRQWRPNLIGYDGLSSYGSPSYYAIQMFSRNLGDEILSVTGLETSIQGCATRDSLTGDIFLKLVNPAATAEPLEIMIKDVKSLAAKARVITLSGNPDDSNSISEPRRVFPVETTLPHVKSAFRYLVPPCSIVILNLDTRS